MYYIWYDYHNMLYNSGKAIVPFTFRAKISLSTFCANISLSTV